VADEPPDPHVAISNRQALPVDEPGLADLARRVLVGEEVRRGELALSFVTEEEMAGLHERFMGEPGPTDVLAFSQDDRELLGDVVVCPAVAGHHNPDLPAELRLLVVHGVLHLLGYDHQVPEERDVMWTRQERYSGVRLDPGEVTA
jgi:probable rRNA maturation factor